MNTRQPIQPVNTTAVLSVAISFTGNRFITGLSDGFRCFRTDNCLTTYQPRLPADGGVAIAEALDDRYVAIVGGGRVPFAKRNIVVFWDCVLGKEVQRFDFHEPVVGIQLNERWMVVLLRERAVVFQYQELAPKQQPTPPSSPEIDLGGKNSPSEQGGVEDEVIRAPNLIHSIHPTGPNPYALATLSGDLLVMPSQTVGQVQLVPLQGGSKRILRAHQSTLRCMALSDDGTLLATASEQGTLFRVYHTKTLDQAAEFRRGVDPARTYSLAFSPNNRWLATTSDKGTLHVFDLRPPDPAASPWAPKVFKDVRSVASAAFYMGDDLPHWQGGTATSYTTDPDGKKRKVKNDVLPLPNDPTGRPPKGVIAFKSRPKRDSPKNEKIVPATSKMDGSDDTGAVIYVIGGGSDARWEVFELRPVTDGLGGYGLVHKGFRKYLTRQFVD
ncbi:hypothetical protein M433DRAFT_76976 [Acidomyces richmondensis BFW]|nr:hypothetical protein M433DRAFT_76976 [Acidomyces richmondensis BFW]